MGNKNSKITPELQLNTVYDFTGKIIKIEPYNIIPLGQITKCNITFTKNGIHFLEIRENSQIDSSIKTYSIPWENIVQYSYRRTLFNFRFKALQKGIEYGELFIEVSDFNRFLSKFRKYYQQ